LALAANFASYLLRTARGLAASRHCVAILNPTQCKHDILYTDGSSTLRVNIAPPLLAAFGLLALKIQASFACSDERRTPRFHSSAQITAATARCPFGTTLRRIAPLGSRPGGLSPLRRYSDLRPGLVEASFPTARRPLRANIASHLLRFASQPDGCSAIAPLHSIHLPPQMHGAPLVVPSVQLRVRIGSPGSWPYGLSPLLRPPLRPPTLAHRSCNSAARSTVRAGRRKSASKTALNHWL